LTIRERGGLKVTKEGWSIVVKNAIDDPKAFDLLCDLLVEQDQAKQLLRETGFGVSGQSLLATVQEVINEALYIPAML
jgi:hypothetical protein